VPLTRFRVDLAAALQVRLPARTTPTPERPAGDWTGDVEPVPFPFWFGPSGKLRHIALDADAGHLLAVSGGGVPHLLSLAGSHREVLPRGWAAGQVLREPEAVLGTANGFVIAGKVTVTGGPTFQLQSNIGGDSIQTGGGLRPVAFHYDL